MSILNSPALVTDGLAFYYDLSNTEKSWIGRPVTNQFLHPTPAGNGSVAFQVEGNGTLFRVTSGTFGGYDIKPTDVVYRFNPVGSGGCWYKGNDVTITAGQTATWSFDYYVDPSITGYVSTNYLANFEGVVGGAIVDPTPSQIGVWKRLTLSSTAGSTGLCRMLLYPGACGGFLATGGFVLYRNPQVEFNAPGNIPSPFVNGTRSNTQAILDLTRQNTITASSLTYGSDGSFSFGGSDFITIPNTTLGNGNTPWTISAWVRTTTTVNDLGLGSVVSNSSGGPVFSMMGVNAGKIVYWTYQNSAWAQKLGVGKTVNDGNWHMLTWVNYNNNTMDMYVDGLLDSNVPNSTSGNNNPIDRIGGSWAGQFVGSIASVSRYTRALSANEIWQNFAALRGRYGI